MGSDGRKKKFTVIGMASILLVAAVVGTVVAVRKHGGDSGEGSTINSNNRAVTDLCRHTDYKQPCEESFKHSKGTSDPRELVKVAFTAAVKKVQEAIDKSSTIKEAEKDPHAAEALETCKVLLNTSIDDLNRSFELVDTFDISRMDEYVADLKCWLSGSVTFQETCLDGFENTTTDAGEKMKNLLKIGNELTRNSLAMIDGITDLLGGVPMMGVSRKLLDENSNENHVAHSGLKFSDGLTPVPRSPPRSLREDEPPQDHLSDGTPVPRSLKEKEPPQDHLSDGTPVPRLLREDEPPQDHLSDGTPVPRWLREDEPPPDHHSDGTPVPRSPPRSLREPEPPQERFSDGTLVPPTPRSPRRPPLKPQGAGRDPPQDRLSDGTLVPPNPPRSPRTPPLKPQSARGDPPPDSNSRDYGHPPGDKNRHLLNMPKPPEDDRNSLDYGHHPPRDKGRRSLIRAVPPDDDYNSLDYERNPPRHNKNRGSRKPPRSLKEEEPPQDFYSNGMPDETSRRSRGPPRSLKEPEPPQEFYSDGTPVNENRRSRRPPRSLRGDEPPPDGNSDQYGRRHPPWGDKNRRSLIDANPATLRPNAVVAQDGSGTFKTIMDAVRTAPRKSTQPFIIFIKKGMYQEYVDVPRHVNNVILLGEGPTRTKITGNKNYVDGVNTYRTATVAVNGDGFMAKDIGIENTAGPTKHQAVALRVSGDMAIFHNCAMDGYQDTLYSHSYRQYYRQCTITGTIDFVFGDAAAVFQDCKLIVRKPLDNQACMVTAQGRKDRHSLGAIVLQGCTITAERDFMTAIPMPKSYLGRPWKEYSRTIIMQSFIDSNIDPTGWSPWMGNFALDTSFYAEFNNKGPGADTSKRVRWPAIKRLSPFEAASFAPGKYIQGDMWIKATGVPYDPAMMRV